MSVDSVGARESLADRSSGQGKNRNWPPGRKGRLPQRALGVSGTTGRKMLFRVEQFPSVWLNREDPWLEDGERAGAPAVSLPSGSGA